MAIFGGKEIEALKKENQRLEGEIERLRKANEDWKTTYSQLQTKMRAVEGQNDVLRREKKDLGVQLGQAEKRAEGLAEAVGRWRKKTTGQDDAYNIVGQSLDGKYHSVSIVIPLPPESGASEVWEFANKQVTRQEGFRLDRVRAGRDGWIATYKKSNSHR